MNKIAVINAGKGRAKKPGSFSSGSLCRTVDSSYVYITVSNIIQILYATCFDMLYGLFL